MVFFSEVRKLLLKKKFFPSWARFLLQIILFYLVIKYFFIGYTGLTIEGGRFYSVFMAEHLDFIGLFRTFLMWGGTLFASLIGYPAYHTDFWLMIRGGSGVHMVYSCLGFDLMAAYVALVLAWPAKRFFKITSLLIGVTIIIFLNMIRLGGLAVLYTTRHYGFFAYVNHHDLFNISVLIVVFIMFVAHVKWSESKN